MIESNFYKNCEICNKTIYYKTKKSLSSSIKSNTKCRTCSTNISKSKISKILKEKYKNGEIVKKISEIQKSKISQTLKNKFKSGEIKPNMEGAHSKESREKMSKSKIGVKQSHESNIKRSISCRKSRCGFSNKGKKHTDETKLKFRLNMIKRLSETCQNFHPPYNKNGCLFFDKIMEKTNTFIQHALNGGEFHIKELGYWVDGYDKENNIVYEWDEERHHYLDGNLTEKDIKRQKDIENFLNCKFIRLREKEIHGKGKQYEDEFLPVEFELKNLVYSRPDGSKMESKIF